MNENTQKQNLNSLIFKLNNNLSQGNLTDLKDTILNICKLKPKLIMQGKIYKSCGNCNEFNENIKIFACNHCYCQKCIENYFLTHLDDVVSNNIKCISCNQMIPLDTVKDIFGGNDSQDKFLDQYNYKFIKELEQNDIKERNEYINAKKQYCNICFEEFFIDKIITLSCDHRQCKQCLDGQLNEKILSGQVTRELLHCPECDCSVDPHIIEQVVSKEVYEKYSMFSLKYIESDNNFEIKKICPGREGIPCDQICFIPKDLKELTCAKCNYTQCPQCNSSVHKLLTCEEAMNPSTDLIKIAKVEKLQKCPICNELVEKESGCNFMTCSYPSCKNKKAYFCYICGTKLQQSEQFSHFLLSGPFGNTCNTFDDY